MGRLTKAAYPIRSGVVPELGRFHLLSGDSEMEGFAFHQNLLAFLGLGPIQYALILAVVALFIFLKIYRSRQS